MQAVKINVENMSFLLPETHFDNYEYATYIQDNKQNIIECVRAYKEWLKQPLGDMPAHPDMTKFKQKTGIIGVPFDMRDVNLFIVDKGVDVVLEVNL